MKGEPRALRHRSITTPEITVKIKSADGHLLWTVPIDTGMPPELHEGDMLGISVALPG